MPDINMSVFEEARRNQLATEVDIQTQVALDDYQVQLSNITNPIQSQDNVVIDRYGEFLPHWNESLDFNMLVKMNMGIAGKQILILHGNDVINDISNGVNTFPDFFDNFDSLDAWTQQSGTWSVSGGKLVRDSSSTWVYLRSNTVAPIGSYILETKYKKSGRAATLLDCDNPMLYTASLSIDDNQGTINIGDDWSIDASDTYSFNSTTYYIYSIYRISGAHFINVSDINRNILATAGTAPNGSGTGRYFGFSYNTASSLVDWIFIRKYAATEPTYVIGAEQNIAVALKSLGRAG